MIGAIEVPEGSADDGYVRGAVLDFVRTSALPGEAVHAVGYAEPHGVDVPKGQQTVEAVSFRNDRFFYRFAGVEGEFPAEFFAPPTHGENFLGVLIGRAGGLFFVPLDGQAAVKFDETRLDPEQPAFQVNLDRMNRIGRAACGLPAPELDAYGYQPAHPSDDALIAKHAAEPGYGEFYMILDGDRHVLHTAPWWTAASAVERFMAESAVDALLNDAPDPDALEADAAFGGPLVMAPGIDG